jgi:hypothetical protein
VPQKDCYFCGSDLSLLLKLGKRSLDFLTLGMREPGARIRRIDITEIPIYIKLAALGSHRQFFLT